MHSWLPHCPLLPWGCVVLGLVLGGFAPKGMAQPRHLDLHPKSQFWVQGEAARVDFTCAVDRVKGGARIPGKRDSLSTVSSKDRTTVVVRVPVKAFDCGNDRMTADLQEALKMEKHPEIRFELIHATVGPPPDSSVQWRRVEVLGPLTIAGTKRLLRFSLVGRAYSEGLYRARGCKTIRMTYFNVEPPTKALGLIKVDNQVEVQFDLLAYAADRSPSSFASLPSTNKPSSCRD